MDLNKGESEISGEVVETEIKHPLQSSWCLWFYNNDKTKSWDMRLQPVATFDSIEDFWSLYNFVRPASGIKSGCDYCLFRENIKPMWEDPVNKAGGRWLLNLPRHSDLDDLWLETLLCLIGEAFDDASEEVNGAVVQLRTKGNKLAVWTKSLNHKDIIMRIGRKLKDRLKFPVQIQYESHEQSATKTGSVSKFLYTL